MKKVGVALFFLLTVMSISWSQDNYYGRSGMPWNTSPQRVVSVMRNPVIIMSDTNTVLWLNENYFGERYNSLIREYGIDRRKNINDILKDNNNLRFTYYSSIDSYDANINIIFENSYASCEKYDIDIDGLSTIEKTRIYNFLKNRLEREHGVPTNIRENNVFKTVKWEKYYTDITLELYTASSGSGSYLWLNSRKSIFKNPPKMI